MTKEEAIEEVVNNFSNLNEKDVEDLLDFLVDELGMSPPMHMDKILNQYIRGWEHK